jgi:hypothetical protein
VHASRKAISFTVITLILLLISLLFLNRRRHRLRTPVVDEVVAGVLLSLPEYPHIGERIRKKAIATSVNADWPNEPYPILFLLWMATESDLLGQKGARELLDTIERLLTWVESETGVAGSWRSRANKMVSPIKRRGHKPAAHTGRDRYTTFQSTLFEFIAARRLAHSDVKLEILADNGSFGSDLAVMPADGSTPLVTVEAYAPHGGIDEWYENIVAEPWRQLIGGQQVEPTPTLGTARPGLTERAIPTLYLIF